MANIKNMRMWESICNDSRIRIEKKMFGLRTLATYTKTGSEIEAVILEYSPNDGTRLKQLLELPVTKMAVAMGHFRPKATVNGNYMLELCRSKDGEFLALMLKQYLNMVYEPVTSALVFEGEDAKTVGVLFE